MTWKKNELILNNHERYVNDWNNYIGKIPHAWKRREYVNNV